jgi:hypothetical protein
LPPSCLAAAAYREVLELNRQALEQLVTPEKRLVVVPGMTGP